MRLRALLAVAAVLAATLAGAFGALSVYSADEELSVGTIRLSVSPGHRGALDLYVPLVDWGARFEAIRLPARLRVDVRTIDRAAVTRVARGDPLDVNAVRDEARDAIARYLRTLLGVVLACALALGLLVALAVRGGPGPRLRWTALLALVGAAGTTAALAVLLPPRGEIDEPQYYAFGPDIPRALRAVEAATRTSSTLDQELNAQLVGLAQLVIAPGQRLPVDDRSPRLVVASDLHNNALAVPVLDRVARDAPVLFAGDLTDRGTPLEAAVVRGVVRAGRPFVFVSGNHDSDTLARRLVRDGAIVLTQDGQLRRDGSRGPVVVEVGGLRVAGYSDPFERRSAEDFRDRYDDVPSPEQQGAFLRWLDGLEGRVDVFMVHEPALLEPALARLRADPPAEPVLFAVGHSHAAGIERIGAATVLNGGSIGAGGTGNLGEGTPIGVATFLYARGPAFAPLAADLVSIDPGTGSSTARRVRLDAP